MKLNIKLNETKYITQQNIKLNETKYKTQTKYLTQ